MIPRTKSSARLVVARCLVPTALLAFSSIAGAQIPLVVVHDFSGTTTEGAFPAASLIQAADGNFYGTTADGGPSGTGTIFKMSPTGAVTTLHTFGDIPDGDYPYGPLIQATDGNFYGVTSGGGPNFGGTIFRMTPSGNVTILQTLDLFGPGGHSPSRSLIQATDGNLYGMTENGGASNRGTIFKMTLAGAITTLHEFAISDGAVPQAGLVQATDGNFYGTTFSGGGGPGCGGIGCGTVFRMTPAGEVVVLHTFPGGVDGGSPQTSLIQAADGSFYGTTLLGGELNGGIIFRITPLGDFTSLHGFGSLTEGFNARELIQAPDGYFYGTTKEGFGRGCGGFGCGTVFKMAPNGSVETLHAFTGNPDGAIPYAGLTLAADGTLYGTTSEGGSVSGGTVFHLDPILCRDTLTLGFSGGTLNLGFTLKSTTPTTWSSWAIFSGGIVNLWSAPIPAVLPAVTFNVPLPGVPAIGPLLILTTLSTPEKGVMCFDWKIADTGGSAHQLMHPK
jgi:uncharacterized repeat protein (TIGR03803 family)